MNKADKAVVKLIVRSQELLENCNHVGGNGVLCACQKRLDVALEGVLRFYTVPHRYQGSGG